jgi:hypothetical protein
VSFPVAFILGFSFNPVEFTWAFHNLLTPMPEEVRNRAETIRRYANFLGDAMILSFLATLMLRNAIPAARVGLDLHNWQSNAAIGIAAGILIVVLQRSVSIASNHLRISPIGCEKAQL